MTVALLASQQPAEALTLGTRWAEAGDDVTVVLLDSAAGILRRAHPAATLVTTARGAGVAVWVHDTALRERAIEHDAEVTVVDLERVAALVGEGATKVQWW